MLECWSAGGLQQGETQSPASISRVVVLTVVLDHSQTKTYDHLIDNRVHFNTASQVALIPHLLQRSTYHSVLEGQDEWGAEFEGIGPVLEK